MNQNGVLALYRRCEIFIAHAQLCAGLIEAVQAINIRTNFVDIAVRSLFRFSGSLRANCVLVYTIDEAFDYAEGDLDTGQTQSWQNRSATSRTSLLTSTPASCSLRSSTQSLSLKPCFRLHSSLTTSSLYQFDFS